MTVPGVGAWQIAGGPRDVTSRIYQTQQPAVFRPPKLRPSVARTRVGHESICTDPIQSHPDVHSVHPSDPIHKYLVSNRNRNLSAPLTVVMLTYISWLNRDS